MIHPCLATMLAVVTTDYPLEPGEPARVPAPGGGRRRSTGSRSTGSARPTTRSSCSPTARAGRAAAPRSDEAFAERAAGRLRGARRGRSSRTARGRPCCSRSRSRALPRRPRRWRSRGAIATSPLVKTAAFGRDPNWGRVLAAAGSAPVQRRLRPARPGPAAASPSTARGVRGRRADGPAVPTLGGAGLPHRARSRSR